MDSDTWAFIFISLIKKQDSMATCHAVLLCGFAF